MTQSLMNAAAFERPPQEFPPAADPGPLPLDPADEERLLQLERKLDLLRDRTRAVAEGYQVGVYVTGRPGSSKTFTILEELRRLGRPLCYRNARLSAAGLFALLQEHPEHTIVLDDITTLVGDKACLSILMAALGGPAGKPRPVTLTTKDERVSVDFSGGIIAVSNVPLKRDPLADALQSRVPLLEHEPGDDLIAAFMRRCAAAGFADLMPTECRLVVEFLISQSAAADYRLDLRSMGKAWQDYRLFKHCKSRRPWQELVASGLKTVVPEHAAYGHKIGSGNCCAAYRRWYEVRGLPLPERRTKMGRPRRKAG